MAKPRNLLPLAIVTFSFCVASTAHGKTVFVRGDAAPGGDGSRSAPFSSLLDVEANSREGDTILVLRSLIPLDGGIALKDNQKIQGFNQSLCSSEPEFDCDVGAAASTITNSTTHNDGHGIVLANNNQVSWLVIRGVQAGNGISGDNVTGNVISHVMVTDMTAGDGTNPATDPLTGNICNLIAEPPVFRGCHAAVVFGFLSPYGAFALTIDDAVLSQLVGHNRTANNKIQHSRIENLANRFAVISASAGSSNFVSDLQIENVTIDGITAGPQAFVIPTIAAVAYENSTNRVSVKASSVDNAAFTGVTGLSGFLFSFLDIAIPASDSTIIMNIDRFRYRNSDGNASFNSEGVEIIAGEAFTGPGSEAGTLELHIQNSDIQGAKATGIGFFADPGDLGYPTKPKSTLFDAGCIENCPPGFTSAGNNILIGNRVAQGFDPGLEIILSNDVAAKAENNWWGTSDGAGLCANLPGEPPTPGTRCLELLGAQPGSLDVEPHLFTSPSSVTWNP